ncbi:MAG TPA: carbamoyltransferase C-terminal domain-containing protein [Polyangiaceae bacterium]|nr:carbamoyltransferase C-terminal domain-containing protein [Polyangiaceae bacterium]
MALTLGIHVGHHASCAVVKDGELVAALQLERLSRRKHHAVDSLSDELPIRQVLDVVGATLSDVDVIVSCLLHGSPGGFGLHRPLIEPSFTLFDPFERRHRVISHHLAHAHCAAAYSPEEDLAIVVSDYAGSSTTDGKDFDEPFADWYADLTSARTMPAVRTECLSIYRARQGASFETQHREYFSFHNESRSAVCSVASLYENVTQAVFRKHNAHGSLMALSAYGTAAGALSLGDMVSEEGDSVVFRNDWQHAVYRKPTIESVATGEYRFRFEDAAALANRTQAACELALLAYARKAARLSGCRHLALAGGTFLNILSNTSIAASGLFESVSLPSAPHDAGIAVGCAFRGAQLMGDRRKRVIHDCLGPVYTRATAQAAVDERGIFVTATRVTPREVATRIAAGAIVARCAGRSEFGPRALGGRSLLASPTFAATKDRLNRIKGREEWRPVAPVVIAEHLDRTFCGPEASPWMTFSHEIRTAHVEALPALRHPDGSTRAQTLRREQDPWLYDLLIEVAAINGYSVLVNTSLNGPGEPIIETPREALSWFLQHDDVDALLLEDLLVERRDPASVFHGAHLTPASENYVLLGPTSSEGASPYDRTLVVRSAQLSVAVESPALKKLFVEGRPYAFEDLLRLDPTLTTIELWRLSVRGLLILEKQS